MIFKISPRIRRNLLSPSLRIWDLAAGEGCSHYSRVASEAADACLPAYWRCTKVSCRECEFCWRTQNTFCFSILEVLSAVKMKFQVSWDVVLCRRVNSSRRFDDLHTFSTLKCISAFVTSGHFHPTTQRKVPEDFNHCVLNVMDMYVCNTPQKSGFNTLFFF
jgi:hypothetical protein